jgi:hypothetical protein
MLFKPNGSRGIVLILGGVFALTRGIPYLPPVIPNPDYVPAALNLITEVIPLTIWAIIWILVGLTCIFYGFHKKDNGAWTALVVMSAVWGASLIISSIFYADASRQWIGGLSYWWIAVLGIYASSRIPVSVRK